MRHQSTHESLAQNHLIDPNFIHDPLNSGEPVDKYDQYLRQSLKRQRSYPEYTKLLYEYLAYEDCIAELPKGAIFSPSDKNEWYVENGTLLVADIETFAVGNVARSSIEPSLIIPKLYDKASTVLDIATLPKLIPGSEVMMKTQITDVLHHNLVGQDVVRMRTITAAVLQEKKNRFYLSNLYLKRDKQGQVIANTKSTPALPDICLPAEIGKSMNILVVNPEYSVIRQKIKDVYVLAAPESISPNSRVKSLRMMGRFAINPTPYSM